jgi:cell division initiation protein
MKITPLEIRQKTFERTLRGYDKDEVNAFLVSLSQEWERTQDEVKELKMKFETAEREVVKLREVENTLYRTLKTAEDTGANVIDQANKSASLLIKESQMKSDAMINEAKMKARNIIEEAEQTTRSLVEEMEEKLKALADQYKTIELYHDNLLSDLKRFTSETTERVERAKNVSREFDPDKFLATARREAKKVMVPNEMEKVVEKVIVETKLVQAKVEQTKFELAEPVTVPEQPRAPRSFFDDIE